MPLRAKSALRGPVGGGASRNRKRKERHADPENASGGVVVATIALIALLAALALALVLPTDALATEDDTSSTPSYLTIDADNKTITVSPSDSDDDNEIQDAIDYIYASSVKTDWTITLTSGTYTHFIVPSGMDNLTVEAADGANVTITTFDGATFTGSYTSDFTNAYYYDGIAISNAANFTLKNVTITVGGFYTNSTFWANAAISFANGKTTSQASNGFTIENVTIVGNDNTYGIFIDNYLNEYTITGCTITNCTTAIYNENTTGFYEDVKITNNTFTGCSFAFHGSYNGTSADDGTIATTGSLTGSFVFTGNTITGTSSQRNKVVIQDSNEYDITVFTISGNTLTNAMIGLVNIQTEGELLPSNDLASSNDLDESSYVVEGTETSSSHASIYVSSEGSHGFWVLTNIDDLAVDWGGNPSKIDTYIKSVIAEANASGLHTLTFDVWDYDDDGDASDDLIKTFTWFKDAIYWVGSDEDEEEPGIEKSVDESTVEVGDTVTFTLTVSAPEYLDLYAELEDIVDYPEGDYVSYTVTVHDEMASVLELDESSIAVTIDGVALSSSYYTVTTSAEDGCTFELAIDLAQLANEGLLVADSDGTDPDVVITYTATVAEGTAAGTYENTAWVTYEADGISEESTVEVQVQEYLDVVIAKAWDDSDDADGLRPDSVTVELYADGEATGLTVTLSEENEWSASFEGLPAYSFDDEGAATAIEYTVVEAEVDGYESAVTGSASEGYVVTNTHEATAAEDEEEADEEETSEPVLAATGDAAGAYAAGAAAMAAAALVVLVSRRRRTA